MLSDPNLKVLNTNEKLLFNKVPTDYPKPGETTRVEKAEVLNTETTLHDGGVLVKMIALSVDPYLRGRMRDPEIESYSPPFHVGQPLSNFGIAIVIRSTTKNKIKLRQGDYVYGIFEFQKWCNLDPNQAAQLRVIKNEENLPWSAYLGVLGMPGQTAYIGWKRFSQAKKGEIVFVTSAAGAVGSSYSVGGNSNVVQLAKAQGLTVIACAGSDDKVEFVQSIGADVVFNYKKKDTETTLKELGHGIDIYWDNVGSEMLDAALQVMNNFGRIICCGAIASYNTPNRYGIKNMHEVVARRLTITGFIMGDFAKEYLSDFYKTYPRMVASGKVKHREQLYYGFDGAEQALVDIQKGENIAKPVVMILDEDGTTNGGLNVSTDGDGTMNVNENRSGIRNGKGSGSENENA